MAQVVWSDNALSDIEEIAAYIERDSIHYAELVVSQLFDRGNSLVKFPRRGRRVPERDDRDIREVLVAPYRIMYWTDGTDSRILTIVHARRNARRVLARILRKK